MWRTVKLGDVVSYTKSNAEGSRLPYVGMENIASETLELIGDIHVPESTSTTFEFNESHVLFGRLRPYLRKVLIPSFRGQCSTEIFCLKPSCELLREYLAYWLLESTVSKQIVSTSTGARMPRANMNKLLEFEFVLPPLAEQQRIVAKLDAAFAEIESSIKLVETKQANAEKLKASLLAASLKGDDAMWKTVKLGDVCDFQGGSQPPKKEFVFEPQHGYIRFLQIRDFKSDKNVTFIPMSKKNRLCNTDDILIGRYGASVGQILRGLEGAYNVALMKTIPNVKMISKGWLYSYLNSPLFQKPLMEVSSRSAQNGFSKDDISGFELPLPPLAEQQRIVAKLDAAFAEIDTVFSTTTLAKENFLALKASLLAQELSPSEAA